MSERVPFHELATAAYCPRKLYYRRLDAEYDLPEIVGRTRELAGAYDALLVGDLHESLADALVVDPDVACDGIRHAFERWPGLRDPVERDVVVTGRDCRGRVSKVVETDEGLVPTFVSPGTPAERGVWKPQRVRATAAAKALSWREGVRIDRALVEYPRHGVVRRVRVTAHRSAEYRRTLRAVRELDGPPPRLRNSSKCDPCEERDRCGVRTRSLASLLGVGR
ncbi:CRISPR-associated protein Cas4 [Halospeciosus flavus]|uniref:CRISPR-associated exonuclease Cas4 n=1 Tax=Halospeciosus flavus TaxID=3032283 RepID=A0ABD5Z713_9EURY|nr:hypothetical protein [Halospeciosus flavus]